MRRCRIQTSHSDLAGQQQGEFHPRPIADREHLARQVLEKRCDRFACRDAGIDRRAVRGSAFATRSERRRTVRARYASRAIGSLPVFVANGGRRPAAPLSPRSVGRVFDALQDADLLRHTWNDRFSAAIDRKATRGDGTAEAAEQARPQLP